MKIKVPTKEHTVNFTFPDNPDMVFTHTREVESKEILIREITQLGGEIVE